MKTRVSIHRHLISALLLIATTAFAQFPEDALRYSLPGLGVGARALGLGTAYSAVANDFSASYWNPAGLAQLQANELSFGLSHVSNRNSSSFLNTQSSFTNSQTSLNDLGLAYVVPTLRGSFVIGIGFGRQNDFTSGLSFRGFNANSSIIQSWSPDGQPYPADLTRGEVLQLARVDTISRTFISPIKNNVTQSGKLLEGGGQNYVSFTGAAEAARNLYVGVSLDFITGSYSYNRTYTEEDLANNYAAFPFDFDYLVVKDIVNADLTGFTAKLGLLYRFSPNARFGLAVKTPSWMTIKETYSSDAQSFFDNGDTRSDPAGGDPGAQNEYDVTTPYVLSAGLSFDAKGFLIAGDIEYIDYTQMEFRNANSRLLGFNNDIKEIFRPVVNLRAGLEYQIPTTNVSLRGGFIYLPSAYDKDPSSFDQKYVTAGIGFIADNAIAVDVGYAYGFWDTFHSIYGSVRTDVENIKTHNILSTVSFRF